MRISIAFCLGFVLSAGLYGSVYAFDRMVKAHRHIDKVVLYLQWFDQAQFAGFYVANDKGFYDDLDLQVDIQAKPTGTGDDWDVPAKVSDAVDPPGGNTDKGGPPKAFGVWTGDQVMKKFYEAPEHHLKITAVGAVFNRSLACFMVLDGSEIFSPRDFGGKTIGVYKGYDSENILQWLLKTYPPRTGPRLITLNPSAKESFKELTSGKIDVLPSYVINEPLEAQAHGTSVRLLEPDFYNLGYYSDTMIVNSDTLSGHRDLVARFLEASERGWRYALENQAEAVNIVVRRNRTLDFDQQTRMLGKLAFYVSTTNPMFAMNKDIWGSMATLLSGAKQDQGSAGALKTVKACDGLCDFAMAQYAHDHYHRDK